MIRGTVNRSFRKAVHAEGTNEDAAVETVAAMGAASALLDASDAASVAAGAAEVH